jgi:hypothetical protein
MTTRRGAGFFARTALLIGCVGATGCAGGASPDMAPGGLNTYSQARRYVDKAVRRSTEGVIIVPSKKAETLYDRTRLADIAQALRVPAAVCFVNRAITTMKRSTAKDGEFVFADVPEGQIRIRTRINSAGQVLRTEVLESGFKDEQMYPCLDEAIRKVKWTQNKSGAVQYIDVFYWVSLGQQAEDHSDKAKAELRRQTAKAATKAKQCLVGRVGEGRYKVETIALVDRDGRTLANRVDPGVLPDKVGECVAIVLRDIRLAKIPEAFVRPILPEVEFVVSKDGAVTFADEQWHALLQREEEALKEARDAELAAAMDDLSTPIDESKIPSGTSMPTYGGSGPTNSLTAGRGAPSPPPTPTAPAAGTGGDPATGGLKLKLGGLRGAGSPSPAKSSAGP